MRANGKPLLLDLFAGAGGSARGYQMAGFYVVGVDIKLQPRYAGDEFYQGDAMTWPLEGFDAIHASPPCQGYIRSGMVAKDGRHPMLVDDVRARLTGAPVPWVIENVPGAPLRADLMLCGTMFGLGVRRHRHFEAGFPLSPFTPASCHHGKPITGVYGHPHGKGGAWRNGKRPMLPSDRETWSREMGIDWMLPREIAQAIPPAYTEFIGRDLLAHIGEGSMTAKTCPHCGVELPPDDHVLRCCEQAKRRASHDLRTANTRFVKRLLADRKVSAQ